MKKRAVIAYAKLIAIGMTIVSLALLAWNIAYAAVEGTSSQKSKESVELPILMYHSILDSTAKAGDYVITPAVLEADLLYLREQGYETVLISDLIRYVNGEGDLPEKPVLLTFDDGYYNNYSYLYPLLQKYDMKAVISIIGKCTEYFSSGEEKMNNNYAYLTWKQLEEMLDSGLVEVQNHTYNLHGKDTRFGLVKVAGESVGDFYSYVSEDLELMQAKMQENLHQRPTTLAYPFGALSKETETLAKHLGFSCTLTCYEKLNIIEKGNPDSLYCLGRVNREYGSSTQEILNRIYK